MYMYRSATLAGRYSDSVPLSEESINGYSENIELTSYCVAGNFEWCKFLHNSKACHMRENTIFEILFWPATHAQPAAGRPAVEK